MKRIVITFICCIFLYSGDLTRGFAANLQEVFNDALLNDEQFKAATAAYGARLKEIPIARSALLPEVILSGDARSHRLKSHVAPTSLTFFDSKGYRVAASQPIIDFAAWASLRVAKSSVKAALAEYDNAKQDLIFRTALAYFAVLRAKADLFYTQQEMDALQHQFRGVKRKYEEGLGSITDMYNVKSQLDVIRALSIQQKNVLNNAYQDLKVITNKRYAKLKDLRTNVPLRNPEPNAVDVWVEKAQKQNLPYLAALYTSESLREEISVQRAGHYPVINAIANHTKLVQNKPDVNTDESTIGVELVLPIYQGGLVVATTEEAQLRYAESVANTQDAYRVATSNATQSFNNIVAGVKRIKADREAIESGTNSFLSNKKAMKVGTRNVIDVLDSQQRLTNILQTHAFDQYSYILDTLSLKLAVGSLSEQDIIAVNELLS